MRFTEVPVLIVGGGAAGTMLSLELARFGVEARTVDRLAMPAATSRAITVHARTAEMLERIDADLVAPFVEHGILNKGYVLHFVDAGGERSEVRPGIDFTGLDSRYGGFLVHGQSDTEDHIRRYTSSRFGRQTEWGKQCVGVRQDDDGVTVTLADGRDSTPTEIVRCQYLVACDGVNSRVRRDLGLSQEESDYAGTWLQNMDVFLDGFPDADDWVHYCAGTDHFIMIVRMPRGYHRLLLSDRGEAAAPDTAPEQGFKRLVDHHFDGVDFGDVAWHSKWQSWVRLADTYRAGRVFLAGDSAHVHSTTGGQGMNCCMQDALNLGWKLALVASGRARPKLLDSYEAERRPIAEQVIWAASSLHEIFMGHGRDIAERAARIRDPAFLDAVVGRCSGLSYTYRDSAPGAGGDDGLMPGPQVGDRAPDAEQPGGRSLYDASRHAGFALLALPGDAGTDGATARMDAIAQARPGLVATAELARSPTLDDRYGRTREPRLYLLRPDGYVAWRGYAAEADNLEAWLDSMLAA